MRPISLIDVNGHTGPKSVVKRLEQLYLMLYIRIISDAVQTINEILDFTKIKNIGSLLTTVHFKKAFDSVNWNFLKKKTDFGPSFIAWTNAFLYTNISSCV